MSYLIAKADDGSDVTISIRGPVEIGRSKEGYIVVAKMGSGSISLGIADATVSRTHASIYLESGRLMIKDLGSKNGTSVNDVLLPGWKPGMQSNPVELKNDNSIKFGCNTLVRVIVGERTLKLEEWNKT